MRTQCECGEQISTQRGQGTQHWKHIGSSSGPLVGRFSQLLSTSTAALNYLRVPWTWSGEVFHILILIQEWGVGGKKVEGSIAFISELILWRKPKLKHLSASQIKRFSSRLRLIGWIRPHSQAWSIKSICRSVAFSSFLFCFVWMLLLSQTAWEVGHGVEGSTIGGNIIGAMGVNGIWAISTEGKEVIPVREGQCYVKISKKMCQF